MTRMQFLKNNTDMKQVKRLSPKAILSLLFSSLIAFLLLLSVFNVSKKFFDIRGNIKKLESEKIELEVKRDNLNEINALLNTPEGVEQTLRDKYNVVKPGEGIIIVTGIDSTENNLMKSSRVSRWWNDILHGLGIRKD